MTLPSARDGRRTAIAVLAAVASAVAAPLAATALFRLNAPTVLVALLLVASAVALTAVPRYGTRLACGWLLGLALYAAFLLWLFSTVTTLPD